MKFLFGTLLLIPFNWIPGFNGMFLIEGAIALAIVGSVAILANSKALMPGTSSYRNRLTLEQAQIGLEIDRINRSRMRLQMLENDDINRIIALPPAPTDEES